MKRLRVVVAEDSATIRGRLLEILHADPDIDVVGEADNGKRAIELCEALLSKSRIWPPFNGRSVETSSSPSAA